MFDGEGEEAASIAPVASRFWSGAPVPVGVLRAVGSVDSGS